MSEATSSKFVVRVWVELIERLIVGAFVFLFLFTTHGVSFEKTVVVLLLFIYFNAAGCYSYFLLKRSENDKSSN